MAILRTSGRPALAPAAFLAAVVLLGTAAPLSAQVVRVTMSTETSHLMITENFQVDVAIQGAGNVEAPTLEGEGFQVLRTSQQLYNINGRVNLTFSYALRPTRVGTIDIAPVAVKAGGAVHRSPSGLRVEVTGIPPQDHLVIELTGPPKGIYIDQEFTVQLRILARRLGGKYEGTDPFTSSRRVTWPQLLIPWLEGRDGFATEDWRKAAEQLLARERGFPINNYVSSRGFFNDEAALFALARTDVTRTASDGKAYRYFAYTLERRFRAKKTGSFTFDPVIVKGVIFTDSPGGQPQALQVTAQSNPLEVEVKTPPDEGRPASFTGAVGKCSVAAAVKPEKAWVGEPLTLDVVVSSEGPLDVIGPPSLASQEGFADLFRIHEEPKTGVVDAQKRSKTFTYGIRAKSSAVKAVPPVAFAWFDPLEEKYVTVKTEPIPVTIEQGKSGGTALLFDTARHEEGKNEVQAVERALYTLYEEPDALEATKPPIAFGPVHGALLAIPPAACLAVVALAGRRRRLRADPALQRARKARRKAGVVLAEASTALAAGDGPGVLAALARAVSRLVADRRGIPAAGLTAADVERALREAGVEEPLVIESAAVLERADGARYARSSVDREALAAAVESVRGLIARLDRALAAAKVNS